MQQPAAAGEAGADGEHAAIARAIEASLEANHQQPSANYNDDQELQRILELSKNDNWIGG